MERRCQRIRGRLHQRAAVVADRLYVGGGFSSIGGEPRTNLAAVNIATGVPLLWDPRPDDWVFALGASDAQVIAGGAFVAVGSEEQAGLGAIDLRTGAPLAFKGTFRALGDDNVGVNAVAVGRGTVFAAGTCDAPGCRRSRYLTGFDARTGRTRNWRALAGRTGDYNALVVRGSRSTWADTSNDRGPPAICRGGDRYAHGARHAMRLDANNAVFDLVIAGNTLYLTGGFTRVGGRRRYGIAAIDLRSGRLTSWSPRLDFRPDAIAVSAHRVYLGGYFRRVDGRHGPTWPQSAAKTVASSDGTRTSTAASARYASSVTRSTPAAPSHQPPARHASTSPRSTPSVAHRPPGTREPTVKSRACLWPRPACSPPASSASSAAPGSKASGCSRVSPSLGVIEHPERLSTFP